MKIHLVIIAMYLALIAGCSSEVDKCVDALLDTEYTTKEQQLNDDDVKAYKAYARLRCMRAAAGK